jgi:Phosphatidylinositol-specific phospholipase C, X domain/Phosphatidylinositol-specific phospholipase C, Y domain
MPKPRILARWDPKDSRFKLPFVKPVNAAFQAGGGLGGSTDLECSTIWRFKQTLMDHVNDVYAELSKEYNLKTFEGVAEWGSCVQLDLSIEDDFFVDKSGGFDDGFNNFMTYLASDNSTALLPYVAGESELSYPMTNYFISSSHNTYLTGNQLYGQSSTDGYRNVLLRGCRCVEIDVWNGEPDSEVEAEARKNLQMKRSPEAAKGMVRNKSDSSMASSSDAPIPQASPAEADDQKPSAPSRVNPHQAEPVVLHGYTATREVTFRKVCESIRDNAFVISDLPVIVSLEVHTNHEQQQKMVDIMQDCFKGLLCDPMDHGMDAAKEAAHSQLPSPLDLKRKILIKVKYSPPKAEPEEHPAPVPDRLQTPQSSQESDTTLTTTTSRATSDDETTKLAQKQPNAKPSKIIEALSRMGIYTRSCHFKALQQSEAAIPTHVFSLSESSLMEVHKSDPAGLFNHNKNFFMRAFPKGTRISSSNLDPAIFWRQGVQMVALNWQKMDAGIMLNEAMFSDTCGWMLKPDRYRSDSVSRKDSKAASSASQLAAFIRLEIFCGQDLPLPKGVEDAKEFKPYVKVELHIQSPSELKERLDQKAIPAKEGEYKHSTKPSKGADPDFKRQVVEFNDLPELTPELSFIR